MNLRKFIRTLLLSAIYCGLVAELNAQCGVERWAVKTGTDADVNLVNLNSTSSTTISALRALTAPGTLPAANRITPTESTVFVINATLTKYKLESDSDYHLVLADASGNTMIAEIPAPSCVGGGSPFGSQITASRSTFDANFSVTSSFQTVSVPVRITGVGFFDFLHGQTGVAPNGIEIHPVLNIVFNPSTQTPDFALSATGSLNIATGSSGSTTVLATPSGGFNSTLTLSASGLPAGVTASFSSTTIAGGSGSSNLNVTVGSSVAAGSYSITVTATGGGVTHTLSVPLVVTSTSGGGGSGDLIVDGGFEQATASGNSAPGWTATSSISGKNVIVKNGSYPHTGTSYALLAGSNSSTDTLTQTVAIPSGASASLTFWVNIVTQETTTSTAYDKLAVEIHNSSGTLLATPLTLSNLNAPSDNNTNGTYYQPAAINLSSYAGQTVQIVFRGINDSTLPTTFRIDDVSLATSGGTGGGGDTTPPTTSISAPANGATVSGTVTVSASATDNVGVTKMELYIDGTLATSATSGPISYSWNTALIGNGSHTLYTKAYDAANNVGTSATITVTVSNSTTQQQLLGNPGFENGSTNTAPWTVGAGVVDNSTAEPAHSGSWKAWLDGYGSTHTDVLSQQVAIPSTITSATLTFWLHIDTAETSTTTAYDTLTVQVQNASGTVLATLATYSNLDANTGYTQVSFNLAAYKGQTIKLVLTGTEDSTLQTSFVVDDFALNVQ